ncbi:hypothetical protein KC921_00300 [Candidatus Woesebacteria bacterium]|nr:hypothetical protein [Candidatus Woesebacteria bacterium]
MHEQPVIDKLSAATSPHDLRPGNGEAEKEINTPYSEATRLLAEAMRDGRIEIPDDLDSDKTRLVVVVPVFAEWNNGNFLRLLDDFAHQDEGGAVLVVVVNSTKNAGSGYKQENLRVKRTLDYVRGRRFSPPADGDQDSAQIQRLNLLRNLDLKSSIVLLDLDGQLESRDLAAVRSAGSILGSSLTNSPETPIAWLDCDTHVSPDFTRQLVGYYDHNTCDALFVNLNYEPNQSDESLATATLEYQFSIAKSYLGIYWRKFLGRNQSVGLGGPTITARSQQLLSALTSLDYLNLDGKGGGEDYEVTRILNSQADCHFSNAISVETSDRRRPSGVGFDSADREKNVYAGSIGESIRWATLSSMVRYDVLRGAVSAFPDWIDVSDLNRLQAVVGLLQLNSREVLEKVRQAIEADGDGDWSTFGVRDDLVTLLGDSDGKNFRVYLDESCKKKFAELITTVVAQQSDGIATSIIEYSQDIDSLFSGFLGRDGDADRYSQYKSHEISRITYAVQSRVAALAGLYADSKRGIDTGSSALVRAFPFLHKYAKEAENPTALLEMVAQKMPDLFSLDDQVAVERRNALATVRAATKMLGEVISSNDDQQSYSALRTLKWIESGKGQISESEYRHISAVLDLSTELADLTKVKKMKRNGLDTVVALDGDGNTLGTFTAFFDRIEIHDHGMISQDDEQIPQVVESWRNLGFEGTLGKINHMTNGERQFELRWGDHSGNEIVQI